MDIEAFYVLAPITLTILIGIGYFAILFARDGEMPMFEIGSFYVSLLTLYTVYPLLTFLTNGQQYSYYNDQRLYDAQPDGQTIGIVGWYYVAYLAAVSVGYIVVRGKSNSRWYATDKLNPMAMWLFLVLFLAIQCYLIVLGSIYDLSYSSYGESYLTLNRLPDELRQFTAHAKGMLLVLKLMLLIYFFQEFKRFLIPILLLLGFELVKAFAKMESRLDIMFVLVSSVILYHFLVKKLHALRAIACGLAVVALFLLMGLIRGGIDFDDKEDRKVLMGSAGEFEAVFANAYDIYTKTRDGDFYVPFQTVLTQYLGFVPQQFLPFQKESYAEWYVNTYYPVYAATGGAFDFGIIPEAMTGYGLPELAVRGLLVGIVLAIVHRRRTNGMKSLVIYMFITIISYTSFRSTMVAPIYMFLFRLLPLYFILYLFGTQPRARQSPRQRNQFVFERVST